MILAFRFDLLRGAALVLAALVVPCASFAQSAADPDWAEARVRAAVEQGLAERFPEASVRLEPRVLRIAAELSDDASLRVELPASDGVPRGHLQAELFRGTERLGWALIYVAHFDSVLVARHAIARGDTLAADLVETAWLETTRFHGDPVVRRTLDGAAQPVVRRALGAGEALRTSDLTWPPAVDTGDAVQVRYARRGLVLTFDARAREPGAIGEAVRVYCQATGSTYRVRLLAPGQAEWLETL